jgi:hypothetical protein
LTLAVATTQTVSTSGDQLIANVVLRPTAANGQLNLRADGQHLGLFVNTNTRLEVATQSATFAN